MKWWNKLEEDKEKKGYQRKKKSLIQDALGKDEQRNYHSSPNYTNMVNKVIIESLNTFTWVQEWQVIQSYISSNKL